MEFYWSSILVFWEIFGILLLNLNSLSENISFSRKKMVMQNVEQSTHIRVHSRVIREFLLKKSG